MTSDEIHRIAEIFEEQEKMRLLYPAGTATMGEYAKALELQGEYGHLVSLKGTMQAFKEAERMRRQSLIDQALNATRLSFPAPETLLSAGETTAVKEIVKTLNLRSATADIERYTLPRFVDADNISKMISASVAASAYGIEIPRLQQTLMAMQAPWLDTLHVEQSVRGFVELQAIGQALKTLDPFGEQLTTALRQDLGDMRDPITWTPEVINDPAARTSFYIKRGFQAELTNFPEEAFEESLERSGIIIEPPALVVRYTCPVPPSDDPELEAAFARTNVAHDWLQRFETYIRSFIDKVMTEAFGPNWMKSNDPGGLRDAWTDKKRKVEAWSGQDRPLIAYADITDYERIICNGKNWAAFERFFVTKENARESLQRISGPRLGTMHARPLTAEEILFLQVEMHRLIKLTER